MEVERNEDDNDDDDGDGENTEEKCERFSAIDETLRAICLMPTESSESLECDAKVRGFIRCFMIALI